LSLGPELFRQRAPTKVHFFGKAGPDAVYFFLNLIFILWGWETEFTLPFFFTSDSLSICRKPNWVLVPSAPKFYLNCLVKRNLTVQSLVKSTFSNLSWSNLRFRILISRSVPSWTFNYTGQMCPGIKNTSRGTSNSRYGGMPRWAWNIRTCRLSLRLVRKCNNPRLWPFVHVTLSSSFQIKRQE